MSNDGFRVVIDRRGSQHFWTLTVNGEQHEGPRGSPTMGLAAENADVFRKQLDLSRYFKQKRQKRSVVAFKLSLACRPASLAIAVRLTWA